MSLSTLNLILICMGVAIALRLISKSKFANFVLAFTIACSGALLIRYHPEKMQHGWRIAKATAQRVMNGDILGAAQPAPQTSPAAKPKSPQPSAESNAKPEPVAATQPAAGTVDEEAATAEVTSAEEANAGEPTAAEETTFEEPQE